MRPRRTASLRVRRHVIADINAVVFCSQVVISVQVTASARSKGNGDVPLELRNQPCMMRPRRTVDPRERNVNNREQCSAALVNIDDLKAQ